VPVHETLEQQEDGVAHEEGPTDLLTRAPADQAERRQRALQPKRVDRHGREEERTRREDRKVAVLLLELREQVPIACQQQQQWRQEEDAGRASAEVFNVQYHRAHEATNARCIARHWNPIELARNASLIRSCTSSLQSRRTHRKRSVSQPGIHP